MSGRWGGTLVSMLDWAGLYSPPSHSALLSALGDLVSAEAAFCLSQPTPTHHAAKQRQGQGQGKGRAPPPSHHSRLVPRELVT